MNYLVVGNGPAGIIAAETIRKVDSTSPIVVLGDEPVPPYSRMAIPYLLVGNIDEAGTYLRKDPDHYRAQAIQLLTGRARRLDAGARRVTLDGGRELPFDRLLIATGSRPSAPPIPGIDLPGVHPCWTLEDARAILRLARPGARVVQMGAGFIGCIIMEALAERGVTLTIVEMGNRMVPRMMTEGAGGLIKRWCEAKGIQVFTSTRVEAIERGGEALRVTLSSGTRLDADLVISATGVRPNIEFLEGSGIATDVGVLVDDAMQTSVEGIYAAGDVAQARDFHTGAPVVNAVQPNAADQARVAGLNMTGQALRSPGTIAMNVLDTLGLVASSFGQWMGVPGGQSVEVKDEAAFRYLRLEFHEDVLVGATSLGLTEHVGVIRGLIQTRARLGSWKDRLLREPTRLMEAYLAATQGVR